ncbi:unnamed protein product [Plutella xylostella]|uniref:RNA helicase n=1 Tax=Plutella xylostella TaxID=51655 RepID=A0A8S4D1X7_PLUXY|nr:unnamed protein product [Plutella xylostella]
MALNVITSFLKRKDAVKVLLQSIKQSTERNLFDVGTCRPILSVNIHKFYSVKTVEQKDVDEYRNEHNITVIGKDIPNPYTDIDNSEFPDYIKDFLRKEGFSKPTVIQSQGWPVALSGQNFVGIAQTGTGKTLAYLLPAIMHIKEKNARKGKGPIVLVLAPTRELARQIEQVAKAFERLLYIRCACIYGGASRNVQAQILQQGVDIVIATPGRLNDFLMSKVTTLSRCTYVVLDEADRMLDMGFEPQIRQALEGVPLERQIMMFSAPGPRRCSI